MSQRLLIDEDSQSRILVSFLRAAGHDVLTVNEADIAGSPDNKILEYASQNNRVVLTRNCDDFDELHQSGLTHSGIFAIYEGKDQSKNMSRQSMVRAIQNIEASGIDIENCFIELNKWTY